MPRKVDPKWGEYGVYVRGEDIKFNFDEIRLLKSFEDFKDWRILEQRLQEISHTYLGWKHKNKDGPSAAEARKALQELKDQGNFSPAVLDNFNHRAHEAVFDVLLCMPASRTIVPPHNTVTTTITAGALQKEVILEAINQALENLSSIRGPDANTDLDYIVSTLVSLFSEATSHPATYTRDERDGKPSSETGRFIVDIMKQIDPALTEQRISTAVRRAVHEEKQA